MELHQIKGRGLRGVLYRLDAKIEVLKTLKSFTRFDWSKEILRLTREIGEIKAGLDSEGMAVWNRIQRKKKEDERINKKLMRSIDSSD